MAYMTPEEEKKYYKEMQKRIDDQFRQAFIQMNSWSASIAFSISPTDVNEDYEYQKPEIDEQGTFYGYKVLYTEVGSDKFISPRYPVVWNDGELTSDIEPSERHMHGLHFTKREDHPELEKYGFRFAGALYRRNAVLVKCALSGTIVETSQGFRAQHAQIIGVKIDGHWYSYPNYQECASAYSCRNSIEEEAKNWKIYGCRWDYGKSDLSFPSADS